ncbi:mannose-1-phosphate guanylyltransferase [Aestuariivirga litoralis]|uniref:mannose-1-phosphate guanylyltransferase n=1 Tax=Aestuariivirga litoralis TaxID=2650924 RepID=UPI002484F882|nr:sugar phosphate nucleotidyltransferase [Aestuariivirga litoralis]MBG1232685.1 mannose-1-phosphate guanylyltransferase/mannose-6-phosphate isomerase [Aestuariivirga litoralis]
MPATVQITPIILCGGAGSRLWPLSREDLPKQFIKFADAPSLFQNTVKRMQGERAGSFAFEKPVVATAVEHRFLVAEQLREIGVEADILLEPARRDSAAAILAAMAFCVDQKRKGLCMVVASDHAMTDVSSFYDHVELSLKAAKDHIVLFGIQPQEPSTDYGYISPGDEIKTLPPVHRVNKFAEKPTAQVAEIYIAKGYLWNSGNFICSAQLLLAEAEALAHEIATPATRSARALRKGDDFIYLDEPTYLEAKSLSIDFAVLEKTSKAAVLPSNFAWSDLGTWKSIHAYLEQDEDGNASIGKAQFTHARNSLVLGNGSLVAVEGLDNIVVTVTSDAILVAHRDASSAMKPLVEKVKRNYPDLLKRPKP